MLLPRLTRIAVMIGLSLLSMTALWWLFAHGNGTPPALAVARPVHIMTHPAPVSLSPGTINTNNGVIPTTSLTNTVVLAHWQGWFGLPTHRRPVPPYTSTAPAVIQSQLEAAQKMGIDGFIVNWYGPATGLSLANEADRAFIDLATQALFTQVNQIANFQLALMYDYNTLNEIQAEARTSRMINDLTYARDHYLPHSAYLTHPTKPLLFLFPASSVVPDIDLGEVRAAVGDQVSLIYQHPNPEPTILPYVDGFFAWVQPTHAEEWSRDGSDWGQGYLEWYYATMADPTLPYSQLLPVGAVWPGFNDSLAPWRTDTPRFIARRAGQTWHDTWELATHYQPPIVQIVTWNDWEEGTATEPEEGNGTWVGTPIHLMDTITPWHTLSGGNAISVALATRAGRDDGAVELAYHLSPTTTADNWVQMRHDFDPPLAIGDHLRFCYKGVTTNTLQIGLVAGAENYFSFNLPQATQLPWWTCTTWDLQGIRKDGHALPNASAIQGMFISVKKSDNKDAGDLGALTVDGLQSLTLLSRTVPTAFAPLITDPTVAQRAATAIAAQQQNSGLIKSWQEEDADLAWLYDQALALLVLAETDLAKAAQLADSLHALQNGDGSWYSGYHANSQPITAVQPLTQPVGANAWMVYALAYYAYKSCSKTALLDAQAGAQWLATLQHTDGSMPDVVGSQGAPTEPNLDAWWAFRATGYMAQADRLEKFLVENIWDAPMGRFKASPDSYEILLDNQTWGAAFLHAIGRDEDARRALSYADQTLATCSSNGLLCGLDGAGPFSVWNEGTLHYIAAGGEQRQFYWEQMVKQQAADGSLPGSPDNFRGYSVWLTSMHGVAPTAWLYFAGTGGPFRTFGKSCCLYLPIITSPTAR